MWVRGHSRSLKLVPFESLAMVSYSPSVVTMAVSVAILEIFSIKQWPRLEIWVWSLALSCTICEFLTLNCTVTSKSGVEVTQGH